MLKVVDAFPEGRRRAVSCVAVGVGTLSEDEGTNIQASHPSNQGLRDTPSEV